MSSLTLEKALQVPTKLSEVAYPASYDASNAASVAIRDPYCNPAPPAIAFPASYVGRFPLPTIEAKSLGGIQRIGIMKDIWGKPSANFVDGCIRDPRDALSASLDRLQQSKVDAVTVIAWRNFNTTGPRWRVVSGSEVRFGAMPDDDLVWAVAEIKRRGLRAIWRLQLLGFQDDKGDNLPFPEPTIANVLATYDAMEDFLLERGTFLQQLGVDAVIIDGISWANFAAVLDVPTFRSRTAALLAKLKTGFKGTLIHAYYDQLRDDPAVTSLIDVYNYVPISFQGRLSDEPGATFNVATVKAEMEKDVAYMARNSGGKPIQWHMGFQSREGIFNGTYAEESGCAAGFNLGSSLSGACFQRDLKADFSVQAIMHEAALRAIADNPQFKTQGFAIDYWMDDNLLPSTTFPHISTSVRGKPAEYIVWKWFTLQ